MKAFFAYAVTATILPLVVAWAVPAISRRVFGRIRSKSLLALFFFATGLLAGFLMLWLSIILFAGLNLPVSVMIPLVMMVPMLAWCSWRVYRNLAADTFIDEFAGALGNILGIVGGIGVFFD